MRIGMITIKDMADLAGVSPTTVTNVLHGRTKKMSKETLQKVQAVIDSSDYVSNMGARLLANYGSKIIGVIMNYDRRGESNIISDPFYGTVVGALEKEIREHGYYMMLYTAGCVDEMVRLAKSWNIEGLITLGCKPSDARKLKEQMNVPVVFIDSYFEDKEYEYYNVGLKDYEGGYLMTKYLINKGHRRIAFLADEEEVVGVDRARLEGFQAALQENGIAFQKEDYIALSFRKQIRHTRFWEFAQLRLKDYTALFFASDFYASEAVNIFETQGIHVPEDISVVGFDNNIFSVNCRPMLTTVQQEVEAKGFYAFDLLYKLIKGEVCEEKNIQLPVKLVIRESVKELKETN